MLTDNGRLEENADGIVLFENKNKNTKTQYE